MNLALLQCDQRTEEELSRLEKQIERCQGEPVLVLSANIKPVYCSVFSSKVVHTERLGIIEGMLSIDWQTKDLRIPCTTHVIRNKPEEENWKKRASLIKVYGNGIKISDKGTFSYTVPKTLSETFLGEKVHPDIPQHPANLFVPDTNVLIFAGIKEVGIYFAGNFVSMEYVVSRLHEHRKGNEGVWNYICTGEVLELDSALISGLNLLGHSGQSATKAYQRIPVRTSQCS
ncbi:MAG: hypothetical protein Q7K43_01790 [Candidatus Woesearchaeota archaeon]|nr:hypothetical protein [Candidatus Woesearchaeota archaeon]